MDLEIELRINGVERRVLIDTHTTLLDALRERLALTGAKKGCDHGRRAKTFAAASARA